MGELITKLVPILHAADPDAQRRFCEQPGLRTTCEDPGYPGFIAVGNDAVESGLSRRAGADPAGSGLTWQPGISDVDAAITACERAGLRFEVTVERPREVPDREKSDHRTGWGCFPKNRLRLAETRVPH